MKLYNHFIMFGAFYGLFLICNSAYSVTIDKDSWNWWGYNGETNVTGTEAGFIIDGDVYLNKSQSCKDFSRGTYGSDEGAIVGLVAEKIYEHGGLFCPYQLQCDNKDKVKRSWTQYYYPMCDNGSRQCTSADCVTLCEPGFYGDDCSISGTGVSFQDKTDYSEKFKNIKLKTSGGSSGEREKSVKAFNSWGRDPENDVILGAVKYVPHGIIARPVRLECKRDGYKAAKSCVNNVSGTGKSKLLCVPGYVANTDNSDCIIKWCGGYTEQYFKEDMHTLVMDGECTKFMCKNSTYGFEDLQSKNCIQCDHGITSNGTCKTADAALAEASIEKPTEEEIKNNVEIKEAEHLLNIQKSVEKDAKKINFCSGFTEWGFDSEIHTAVPDKSNNCVKYRCHAGKAFPKIGDYSCVECPTSLMGGENSNGICIKCQAREIYDLDKKQCATAKKLDKSMLLYGPKASNGNKNDYDESWCWTKKDIKDYNDCITGKSETESE